MADTTVDAGVAVIRVWALRSVGTAGNACYAVDYCPPSDYGYTIAAATVAVADADCIELDAVTPSDYSYSSR